MKALKKIVAMKSVNRRLTVSVSSVVVLGSTFLGLTMGTAAAFSPTPIPPPNPTPISGGVSGLTLSLVRTSNIRTTDTGSTTPLWNAVLTWRASSGDDTFQVWREASNADPTATGSTTYTVNEAGAGPFRFVDSGLADGSWVRYHVTALGSSGKPIGWQGIVVGETVYVPPAMPAANLLQAFEASNAVPAYPNIPRASVVADLVNIINDPDTYVNQGDTGGCGLATIEYELAKRSPGALVQIMESLYYTGAFTDSGTHYAAGSDTRSSPVRPKVSAANWLFIASVRDAPEPGAPHRCFDRTRQPGLVHNPGGGAGADVGSFGAV